MYCKYCGKQTENQDGVCNECKEKNNRQTDDFFSDAPSQNYTYEQQAKPVQNFYDKKFGFGQALTSTILGVVGYIFVFIALEVIAILESYGSDITAGIVFFVLSLPMGIISLVYGIASIKRFKEASSHGVKPIATLILGIVGTVAGGLTLLFAFIVFCLIIAFI